MHTTEHDELAVGAGRCLPGKLERIPGDVGELDYFVTLIVVAEHENPVAQGGFRSPRALHQVGIAGGRKLARAVHTSFRARVRLLAKQ